VLLLLLGGGRFAAICSVAIAACRYLQLSVAIHGQRPFVLLLLICSSGRRRRVANNPCSPLRGRGGNPKGKAAIAVERDLLGIFRAIFTIPSCRAFWIVERMYSAYEVDQFFRYLLYKACFGQAKINREIHFF